MGKIDHIKPVIPDRRPPTLGAIGLIAVIRFYRLAISGFLGHCCRFWPSCSVYAIEAVKNHGCLKGCFLAIRRLLRCHPWHPGGIDRVPEHESVD